MTYCGRLPSGASGVCSDESVGLRGDSVLAGSGNNGGSVVPGVFVGLAVAGCPVMLAAVSLVGAGALTTPGKRTGLQPAENKTTNNTKGKNGIFRIN